MASSSTMATWWDSSTNKDTFKTLVDKWFNSTDRKPLVEWQNMMRDLSSEDEYERRGRFAGLDYGAEVDEGSNITIQDAKFGQVKDFTHKRFGLGFRITDRMKRFEKIGLYEFLVKDARNKAEETKDVEIAKLWNNLTATTYNANSFDGYAIAYNSHTCLDDAATTYDNYLDAALSTSSLESARNYFDYMYDDQGNIFTANPDTLAVNYSLVVTAEELLGSTLKPHEFSNTINYFKEHDLKIFDYHRATSTTWWVMLARNNDKYDGFVYTAQEPDIKIYDAPDQSRDVIVDSQQYFIYGMGNKDCLDCEQSQSENLSNSGESLLWKIYKLQRDNPELSPTWESAETRREAPYMGEGIVQTTNMKVVAKAIGGTDPRMVRYGLDSKQLESENSSNSVKSLLWQIYQSWRDNTEPSPDGEGVETRRRVPLRGKGIVQPTNIFNSDESHGWDAMLGILDQIG